VSGTRFTVRVNAIHYEAVDVISLTLVLLNGEILPEVDPGAHLIVHLPNGLARSYSLSNTQSADGYRLTVARDLKSRGGSTWIHDQLRVGQVLEIEPPANNFQLEEGATESIFIAGGIGVTPFIPMARRLSSLGRRWTLYYCVRKANRAALLGEIQAIAAEGNGSVIANFDEEPGGSLLDLGAVFRGARPDTHFYCCGPTGMLAAYRAAADVASVPSGLVHFEYFSNATPLAVSDAGYVVELRKSQREIAVQPGQTILKALIDAGVRMQYSCEEGICGACEVRVLEGIPDHHDMILSEHEKRESKIMMVCCSGSKSERLVLDL
jgi:ferredoxin-NADP reductase